MKSFWKQIYSWELICHPNAETELFRDSHSCRWSGDLIRGFCHHHVTQGNFLSRRFNDIGNSIDALFNDSHMAIKKRIAWDITFPPKLIIDSVLCNMVLLCRSESILIIILASLPTGSKTNLIDILFIVGIIVVQNRYSGNEICNIGPLATDAFM